MSTVIQGGSAVASWLVRSTADRTVRVHGPGTLSCVLGSYADITLPYCDSSLPLIHVSRQVMNLDTGIVIPVRCSTN